MMKDGSLVRCLDTLELGVVVESKRSSIGLMVLVRWGNGEKVWTRSIDLESIESY